MESTARDELIAEAEQLSAIAESIQCPAVQLAVLPFLGSLETGELKLTAKNIPDIGKRHGLKFQMKPMAWAPIHSLS
jgi:hypothetical protein